MTEENGVVENGADDMTETELVREKKLKSWFEGENDAVLCVEVIDGQKGVMRFDTAALPQEIKDKMIPFATLKKLGSQGACSGKKGIHAEDAIEATWTSLLNNDWSLRQPAAPKVSFKELSANLNELSADEQAEARALLERLGLKIG